jgi:hypothetical protein
MPRDYPTPREHSRPGYGFGVRTSSVQQPPLCELFHYLSKMDCFPTL